MNERPACLSERAFTYCPGCGHTIVLRLLAEVIDELGLAERTVGVASVGCTVTAYEHFRLDFTEAPHGRAAAVATGVRRALPDDRVVFTCQGDGDLAAIGLAETLHAANRGERIAVLFLNNTVYGMTGGQLAPTTLPGQCTVTCPAGRDAARYEGAPLRLAEMIARLDAPVYVVRTAVHDANGVAATRAALRHALALQRDGRGYVFVEVLTQCPVNLGLTPAAASRWLRETATRYFPVGVLRDRSAGDGHA